jgi:type IV secretion system protein TrbL
MTPIGAPARWRARIVAAARSPRATTWFSVALVSVGLGVASTLYAQAAAQPDGVLDGIANAYQVASRSWLARLTPVAQKTFVVLAAIEFAISGAIYGLRRDSLDDIAGRFILKFCLIAGLLALVTSYSYWIPPIVSGFATAGEQAIGQNGVVGPSEVVDVGWSLAGNMLLSFEAGGILMHPVTVLVGGLEALIVIIAYVLIAAALTSALVESYVVLTAGVVFLGFAACRATAGIGEGLLNNVVTLGIKIFFLYLLVAVGIELSRTWVAQALAVSAGQLGLGALSQVFGGSLVFCILVLSLPDRVAQRIGGHLSFGIVAALRAF